MRHFSDEAPPEAVVEAILAEAAWAPSGGNDQPWEVVLLDPAAGHRLRAQFEQRGWAALRPKLWGLVERLEGRPLSIAEAAPRVQGLVERDGVLGGEAWALLVHYAPERLHRRDLTRIWRSWRHGGAGLRALGDSFRTLTTLNARVRNDSVACFVYALCLAAAERGLGSCIQYAYGAFEPEVKARFGVPASHRFVGVVWIGEPREEAGGRAAVGRRRKPVPTTRLT